MKTALIRPICKDRNLKYIITWQVEGLEIVQAIDENGNSKYIVIDIYGNVCDDTDISLSRALVRAAAIENGSDSHIEEAFLLLGI